MKHFLIELLAGALFLGAFVGLIALVVVGARLILPVVAVVLAGWALRSLGADVIKEWKQWREMKVRP